MQRLCNDFLDEIYNFTELFIALVELMNYTCKIKHYMPDTAYRPSLSE